MRILSAIIETVTSDQLTSQMDRSTCSSQCCSLIISGCSLRFTFLLIALLPVAVIAQEWTAPGSPLSGARFVSPDINQASNKVTHRTIEDDSYLTFVGGTGVDVGTGTHRALDGDLILSMRTRSSGLIMTDQAIQTNLRDSGGDVYVI